MQTNSTPGQTKTNSDIGSYGIATTLLLVAVTSVWLAVGGVLFWRKSTDRAILLISLQLVLTGGVIIPPYPGALGNYGVWWVPILFLEFLAGATLIFVYTFPDGRFVPRWTRWFALGWVAVVQETMQPAHVSLRLRKPERHAQRDASAWVSTPPLP